jgi:RimJ/RimL family protein N-acetyltransferase
MSEIYLQELKEKDFTEEYVSWHSNEHTAFYSGSNRVFTQNNLLEEFHRGKVENNIFHYGIFSEADLKLIGVLKLGIVNWSNLSSDMIVFIGDRDYLGKGLAVKAIEQGNEIAFKTHKLRKLYGGMYYENIASVKAYLNADWIIEGVLKDHYLYNNRPQDRILVACFNPEIFHDEYHKSGKYSFEDIYG